MADREVLSERGRNKLCVNGFMYTFDRLASDTLTRFWRRERKGDGFKGRVHERNGIVTKVMRTCAIEAMSCVTIMKRRAAETDETTSVVMCNAVTDIAEASQGFLPRMDAMKKRIRRIR